LREKWYKRVGDKYVKRIPLDIQITPATLLHWYLGDGSLRRDLRTPNSRPCVRLSTEGFIREDIELLIRKLNDIGLEFYSVPKLNKDKKTGYTLYSKTSSVFKFFRLIGLEPIKEIKHCITRHDKSLGKIYRFVHKWPTRSDWIKILSKTDEISLLLKERRLTLGLGQRKLAKIVKTTQDRISKIERGKQHPNISFFKSLLKALQLDVKDTLDELSLR
jgi:DNA-binding XRE family transcriptional regulator